MRFPLWSCSSLQFGLSQKMHGITFHSCPAQEISEVRLAAQSRRKQERQVMEAMSLTSTLVSTISEYKISAVDAAALREYSNAQSSSIGHLQTQRIPRPLLKPRIEHSNPPGICDDIVRPLAMLIGCLC